MPKPRARPEFDTVCVPVMEELRRAGFQVAFLGKTFFNGRVWISSVPKNIPDVYAWHGERKVSLWCELKAPGEKPTPGQAAFLEDHAGSETQAVCWSSVALCVMWLRLEGLTELRDGKVYYLYGIHRVPDHHVTEEQEWSS